MWNGSEMEFEQLVREYNAAVYGTAFAYLNSNSEIDDVVQETFIELYYKYDTIRDKTKIGAWLCGVCRNIARKHLRAARFTLSLEQASHKATADPADLYEKTEQRSAVHAAIARLSQPVAETVSLYYITGLPVNKIAELLGVPQGTVKSRLYEGRRKLKGELNFMMKPESLYETELNEKVRKVICDAEQAMQKEDKDSAVLLLDAAIAEIEENTNHCRALAELYRKRSAAEFMSDRAKAAEDDARALEYARRTGDERMIAEYMLEEAFNASSSEEQAEKMHKTYELAERCGLNGICAEAAYWEAVNDIRNGAENKARDGLNLALKHYEKLRGADHIDVCDGNILRVRALAKGALEALDLLHDAGRSMGNWESCNTFCQILRRDGETVTIHNNYGWDIPGKQYNYRSIHSVFDGIGYLFAEELLDHDEVVYEYYDFGGVLRKKTYTVMSRADEITIPAGHFTGCIRLCVRESMSEADAADPAKKESWEDLSEHTMIFCPGVGLLYDSCTYVNSPSRNAEYGGSRQLSRYVLAKSSSHLLPLEEGNEFEYLAFDAAGHPVSEQKTYRDLYRVDVVTPDGVLYVSNFGFSFHD